MKKELGSGVGVLAVLAFIVHSAFPPGAERGATVATPEKSQAAASDSADKTESPLLEGPWLATRGSLGPVAPRVPSLAEIRALTKGLAAVGGIETESARIILGIPRANVTCIVATVADPVHTRLSLLFDEQVEAISSSAERQGWEFVTQWLPWTIAEPGKAGKFKERLAERTLERDQESLPGVLVFRQPQAANSEIKYRGLLVFLVPETPTAGIAGAPFNAAVNLALATQGSLGFLAPSFSGSFKSLTTLIDGWRRQRDFLSFASPHKIYSGTASSSERAALFRKLTGFEFHAGVASDSASSDVFKKVLAHYGIPLNHAAYLVEGESGHATAFMTVVHKESDDIKAAMHKKSDDIKTAVQEKRDDIQTYRYPRDIANLRNAYQEANGNSKDKAQNPTVDFTMKDRSHGEDSIPIFSDAHTPVAQSALIEAIARDLRNDRIELAYILATNTLDALFLTRIIRKESPDTRVLIGDGDLIFVPAAAQEAISGTLFLSTYPLFLQGDKWTSDDDGRIHAFLSANSQGLFVVTQQLLHDLTDGHLDQPGFEYFPINEKKPYPGLWLLTVNRNGMAPVDWFENEVDQKGAQAASRWFDIVPDTGEAPEFSYPTPPTGWFLTVIGMGLASLLGCFMTLRANLADAPPIPFWLLIHEKSAASVLTLMGACFSMSLSLLILHLPAWQFLGQAGSVRVLTAVAFSLVAMSAPLLTVAAIARRRRPLIHGMARRHKMLALFVAFAYLGLAIAWAWSCFWLDPQSSILFRYRALDLFSGASPAAPVLVLALVFLMRCLMSFRRYSEVAWDSPSLIFHNDVKMHNLMRPHVLAVEAHLKSGIEAMDSKMKSPIAWRYTAVGVIVMFCLLPLWPSLAAFERAPYSFALQASVALVLLALAIACQDLVNMWLHLRGMLQLLEISPLRGAIGRVVKQWPRQAVWALWRTISRQRLAAQMLLSLHNRHQSVIMERKMLIDYTKFRALSESRFTHKAQKYGSEQHSAVSEYEHECAKLAAHILEHELVPYWDKSPLNDNGDPHRTEKDNPADSAARHGADFVALQLCNYILFAVRHTQRLAWGISAGLLLTILALVSYAPKSPQMLGRIVALLFFGFGCVIAWVFAGMERNWVLSRIGRTSPGHLNFEFYARLGSVIVLPFSAVLVHLFPSLGAFLSSFVAPSMEALK